MKTDYEKPTMEILEHNIEIITTSSETWGKGDITDLTDLSDLSDLPSGN